MNKKTYMGALIIALFTIGAMFAIADISWVDDTTGLGYSYDATLDKTTIGNRIIVDQELIDIVAGVDLKTQGPGTFEIRNDAQTEWFQFDITNGEINASTLTADLTIGQDDANLVFLPATSRINMEMGGVPFIKFIDGFLSFFDATAEDTGLVGVNNSASIHFGMTAGGIGNGIRFADGVQNIAQFADGQFSLDTSFSTPVIKTLGSGSGGLWITDSSDNLMIALDPSGNHDVEGELNVSGISGDGSGQVVCIKGDGALGTCSDAPNVNGTCTCG